LENAHFEILPILSLRHIRESFSFFQLFRLHLASKLAKSYFKTLKYQEEYKNVREGKFFRAAEYMNGLEGGAEVLPRNTMWSPQKNIE
jgi:hypothetical protein